MNREMLVWLGAILGVIALVAVDALEVLRAQRAAGVVTLRRWLAGVRENWDGSYLLALVKYGGMLLCLLWFILCVLSPVRISGRSMDATLHDGQVLAVAGVKHNPLAKVDRGDIITIQSEAVGHCIIKRVIALPGDTVEIRENVVYVNGIALEETYLPEPMVTENIPANTLDEGEYFVLGDNRNISLDSRRIGPVTEGEILGIAVFDISGLALLPGTDTFDALEQPTLLQGLGIFG